jgi:hypothetical protein
MFPDGLNKTSDWGAVASLHVCSLLAKGTLSPETVFIGVIYEDDMPPSLLQDVSMFSYVHIYKEKKLQLCRTFLRLMLHG